MDKDCKEKGWCKESGGGGRKLDADDDREDECGICLETCTKMVLPNCNHAMCINCYRDWYYSPAALAYPSESEVYYLSSMISEPGSLSIRPHVIRHHKKLPAV
jgi:hypothetical protein